MNRDALLDRNACLNNGPFAHAEYTVQAVYLLTVSLPTKHHMVFEFGCGGDTLGDLYHFSTLVGDSLDEHTQDALNCVKHLGSHGTQAARLERFFRHIDVQCESVLQHPI